MESNGNLLKLLVLAAIVFAVFKFDTTRQFATDLISRVWTTATPAPTASPSPSPSAESLNAQSIVKAYMRERSVPQCTLSFLDWSNFVSSVQSSAITLRYSVQQPGHPDTTATVRFTLRGGNVTRMDMVQSGARPAVATPPARIQPPVVIDHFTAPLLAAIHGPSLTLELDNAYSLAQLDIAKARAQAQRKPLGFLMVWGQFFDHESDPRSTSSDSALVHFYEVFNPQLVLVFVRHETELGLVPPAVAKGFRGPNEGGYAPNMAVTDAGATEFIVEIPYRDLDGPGRDQIFAEGGRVIDQWLAIHPDAMATPSQSPIP